MIQGSSLSAQYERYVTRFPGKAARKLRGLDDLLERKPELEYERNARDTLLAAFRAKGRCEVCGRELQKESSVAKGQGAVCAKKRRDAERRRQEMAA